MDDFRSYYVIPSYFVSIMEIAVELGALKVYNNSYGSQYIDVETGEVYASAVNFNEDLSVFLCDYYAKDYFEKLQKVVDILIGK